jgi:hypothetical protein
MMLRYAEWAWLGLPLMAVSGALGQEPAQAPAGALRGPDGLSNGSSSLAAHGLMMRMRFRSTHPTQIEVSHARRSRTGLGAMGRYFAVPFDSILIVPRAAISTI